MISLCCHFSCEYVGSGRIGNGGVATCSSKELHRLFSWSNSVISKKKEPHDLAMMLLNQGLLKNVVNGTNTKELSSVLCLVDICLIVIS